MVKYHQMLKLFVVLFLCTAFIFSFSHFGAKAFEVITNSNSQYAEGTTLGPIDISEKNEEEALSLLEEKYVEWIKDSSIELQYGDKTVPFDLNQFYLDAQQTIDSIKDGQHNSPYIQIDKLSLQEQIEILFPEINTSDLDLEKLMNRLNETASLFETGSQSINLDSDYLLGDKKAVIIHTANVEMENVPDSLQSFVAKNPKIELAEESTFSLLDFAKEQKNESVDALSILATGLYQAILPSNFLILERNISNSLPDYAKLGFEAKVNPSNNTDFIIKNPNKEKYIFEFSLEKNQLKVTLKGQKFIYNYKASTKDEQSFKPKTIVQYSPLLLSGSTKILTAGADGHLIKVYRDVYQGDSFLKSEFIAEDYYPPVYQVQVQGLKSSQQGVAQTTETITSQTGTTESSQVTETETQTSTSSEAEQTNSDESDLWGKPDEQPK